MSLVNCLDGNYHNNSNLLKNENRFNVFPSDWARDSSKNENETNIVYHSFLHLYSSWCVVYLVSIYETSQWNLSTVFLRDKQHLKRQLEAWSRDLRFSHFLFTVQYLSPHMIAITTLKDFCLSFDHRKAIQTANNTFPHGH